MTKKEQLIWVYPKNGWVSNFNKTFVYGWCNPKAKLFISIVGARHGVPVQIFPNGNFAQAINLPNEKNVIRLVQILNGKKNIISRNVSVKKNVGTYQGKPLKLKTKSNYYKKGNDTVIVIDPGHGGKEFGTHSPKGIPEKHFNLQIAKLLYKKLCGVMPRDDRNRKIYLTRSKDKFVSLKQRVSFAKKEKCNLFISIHHNALPDNENPLKHRGVGIYYTHDFAKPFAKKLLDSISKEAGLKRYGIFKRDFAVTKPDFYCGVLIECGFLIHPEEGEYIVEKNVQRKIVNGIMNAM